MATKLEGNYLAIKGVMSRMSACIMANTSITLPNWEIHACRLQPVSFDKVVHLDPNIDNAGKNYRGDSPINKYNGP